MRIDGELLEARVERRTPDEVPALVGDALALALAIQVQNVAHIVKFVAVVGVAHGERAIMREVQGLDKVRIDRVKLRGNRRTPR